MLKLLLFDALAVTAATLTAPVYAQGAISWYLN